MRSTTILRAGGVLLLAATLHAAFVNPQIPAFRGAPLSEFAGWEDWASPFGGSNPPDHPNTTPGASFDIVQTQFGGILTGGTIYNPSNPSSFDLSHAPAPSIASPDLALVVLQIRTLGQELDLSTVKIRYPGPGGTVVVPHDQYTELHRLPLGGGLGDEVEHMFQWDLSGIADVIPSYVIRFKAQSPHMGLDTVLLDAQWAQSSTGTSYCTAGVSASGCQATLSAAGTPSATAPSGFLLQASGVEGLKDGLFFYGANGRQASPWGNGTSFQCVVPPVSRGGLLTGTGTAGACDGAFSQDLNARWCPTCPKPNHNPGAGAVVQAQLWYRDPLNTSNQTTSLSDAIEFTVAP